MCVFLVIRGVESEWYYVPSKGRARVELSAAKKGDGYRKGELSGGLLREEKASGRSSFG